jgi:methionyl-tRNA synthetase (EC 6.1.1.10)
VLYVWVDAPIEYIASTKQYSERVGTELYDWEQPWKEAGEIVHVIGRDIIQHHAIFWPAMLDGAGYTEPRAIMASGFVTLGGKGFSTSRNRAVWADEYLDEGFHPDLLRYYLATNGGFQQDVDFSWDKFRDRVNTELVGTLGNFVYRSLLFAARNYGGAPDAEVSDTVDDRIVAAIDDFTAAINDYSIRAAGTAAIDLAQFGNEYIQRNEPWNLVDDDPEAAEQVIYDCVQLAKALAVLFEPIAPETCARLWTQLGEDGDVADATVDVAREAPQGAFEEPTELFAKIEPERVEELNAKLDERVAEATDSEDREGDDTDADADRDDADADADSDDANADADNNDADTAVDLEPLADDRISFEEFQSLDIRVAEILNADPVEDADKLAKLQVDIGHEQRQIVAGIKQLHDLDDLPGTRIIVVANLEKAELFGVESNGMLLAAGEEADLLTTHDDAPVGTRIK